MRPGPSGVPEVMRRLVPFAIAAVLLGAVLVLIAPWADGGDPEAVTLADPDATYDPVAAGEALPDGYRIGLDRDAIEPVYRPRFTGADDVDWPADSLVVGVAGAAEAKAYPITHLNSREMVVDSLEGIPILVTW